MKNKFTPKCSEARLDEAALEAVAIKLTDQYRVVDMEWSSRHRGTRIKYVVSSCDKWRINEVKAIIVFLSTGGWWVVADDPAFDSMFKDLGPFETAAETIQVADIHHRPIMY